MRRCRSERSKRQECLRRQWSVSLENYWFILKIQKNAYIWDPIEFYDDLEHSIFKIMLTCETIVGLWRCWPGENVYMWDPTKFYDELEHSIFERILTYRTIPNFMTSWNTIFKIMLTCGTRVGLWHCCGAYGVTKLAWNRECSVQYQPLWWKSFFVTKFARKWNIMTRSARNIINQWR
jgi:hypothetical protein